MPYGLSAEIKTKPGKREEVISLLLRDVEGLVAYGCHAYIVSRSEDDADVVHVMEVWESKAAHAASLQLPETRAAIAEAMPLMTGEFTGRQLEVAGGIGLT
jgi:quinol monooxygenase YgiN